MASHTGILRFHSPHAFKETVQRLHAALAERGIKVFASIDQQAEAVAIGLMMPPTTLIIFGNPKAGTPLMLANPDAGIDLPLKALVVENEPGRVEVLINSTKYLIERHALPQALETNLLPVEALVANVLGVKPESN
ncbi:DUF302 domain-containing protein [Dyella nitratireducens]|uniref:DUF302 domain-containing protein n=1 Tax=Dyella nitratireducens TaxID=1849580 RepID=A0ABQ1GXG0_9GAMM|nr:DUF302 domain-containing protein [Dyella nitratireducens]GGA51853.1 hypothetical protein GCM10010981_46600 [Dyella nitratireducens]GLQ41649.1 hypothetical protein GCM10007902_14990 [Dyella nitratireducens]